jgi:ATP-dependent DNA helicase RecQ
MESTNSQAESVDTLLSVLAKYWGYDTFLPLQREAMLCAVQGRDSVVVLPTGGGKSLCYQAPALVREGLTLVVSPLISLMKDQVDTLLESGVPAACVNSTMPPAERREVADRIASGELKLLYIAPERLLADRTLDFLARSNLTMVAIDEAHCISAWGHDFRPEYRGLRVLKERFPEIGVHAYTATASEHVRRDIAEQLDLREPAILVGSFDRPNLVYSVERASNRFGQVCAVIERHPGESGIVYCISRKEVDKTAAALAQLGHRALPYHAGLTDVERHRNQEAFIREEAQIIVATVAFGMGIDKSNVRFVVHAGMPKSLEHYQQESGRAGRDGLEAECRLLFSGNDFAAWSRMLDSGDPSARQGGLRALQGMHEYCVGVTCRHRAIVEYFGQSLECENCGACDVCLGDLDLVDDPLIVGQKIVSCVARLKERFGADYTAKVLAGSTEQRILEQGHNELSTYGLLTDESLRTIRDWIEQVVGQGFLAKSGEYQTLTITDQGRGLLRGELAPRLLRPAEKKIAQGQHESVSWEGVDRGLFEALRALRKEIADAKQVPAYVVFGDATLRDLARRRPTSDAGMRNVRGIGEKKLADYGQLFLQTITNYSSQHSLSVDVEPNPTPAQPRATVERDISTSSMPAFEFFRQQMSVPEVAQQMNRAVSTVYGYLGDFLRHERITRPEPWVAGEIVEQIEAAARKLGWQRLKPIYDALGGQVNYNDIRVVVTCLANRTPTEDVAED